MFYKLLQADDGKVKGSVAIMDVMETLTFKDALRTYAEDPETHEDDKMIAVQMIADIRKGENHE